MLQRLKADADVAAIPVIIASAVADQHRGRSQGAAYVIQKPYGRSEVHAILAKLELGNVAPSNEAVTDLATADAVDPR